MSLRVRLLGTIIGAIVLFFLISVIAARLVLQHDLLDLGKTEVANGAGAFGGYWDSHKDQIKLLVSQDAVSDSLRKVLLAKNVGAMRAQLANIARTSGLSFLTIVDDRGNVVARASGPQPGSLAKNKLVRRALMGETVSTATLLGSKTLSGEGLAAQAQATITGPDGKTVAQNSQGLALVAAAPISDQNERTIGAIYGGILLNHEFTTNGYYDLIDQAAHSLGGSAAILEGDAIVASTIMRPDGTREVDVQVPVADSVLKTGQPYTGADTVGGTEYLVHIDPIQNDQGKTIGARWYGVPMTQITSIINHTTQTLVLWGLLAMIIALALAIPIVQALSNTL
ncbi:MAG: cache domain-containing protein, partial [Vulcanimicrobiaceae bacterium]